MATSSDSDETLKCSICLEGYKEPRTLPGCSHSFCEACLVSHVNKLITEGQLGLEFQCPVCRLPSKSPEDKNDIIVWVRMMDKGGEPERRGKTKDGNEECCYPCRQLNRSNSSKHYCFNCEIYLCSQCSEILHACKHYKNHTVVELKGDDAERLNETALNLMNQFLTCAEHPHNSNEFYCEDHDALVCSTCVIANHRYCKTLNDVHNISKFTLQTAMTKINEITDSQSKYIEQIIDIYKQNIDENKTVAELFRTEIVNLKRNVVRLLDMLEHNLNQDLSAMTKNINIQCLDEIEELTEMLKKLDVTQHLTKTYSTAVAIKKDQVFICIEGIKKICKENERRFLEKGNTLASKKVKLSKKDALNAILNIDTNNTSELATVEEIESVVYLPRYCAAYGNQTFIAKMVHSQSIKAKGNGNDPTYNDILFLSNNMILLVDSYHGYCCLVDNHYQEVAAREVVSENDQSRPTNFRKLHYAALLINDLIAISVFRNKKIFLMSRCDLSIKTEIPCKYSPKAMVGLDNNIIAISWENPPAFGIIQIQENTYAEKILLTEDKAGRQFKSFDYMAIDKERRHVIQPCHVDKAVYCFSFDGDPIFTYKSESLKDPKGVAVDCHGNVYVCNTEACRIHVLSADGLEMRTISNRCPAKPLAIAFDKEGVKFAVSHETRTWDNIYFFSLVEC